jgi:hypothetical protein
MRPVSPRGERMLQAVGLVANVPWVRRVFPALDQFLSVLQKIWKDFVIIAQMCHQAKGRVWVEPRSP